MAKYRLLITEITNFGDLRCVAGWDLDRNKMIRPEPHTRGFWPSSYAASSGPFKLGNVVQFEASKPNPSTDFPHRTEDRVVAGKIVPQEPLKAAVGKELLRAAAFNSLEELFENNLVVDGSKAYIPVGTQCSSLGGLLISTEGVAVESYTNYNGKHRLRLTFQDQSNDLAPNLTSTKAYAIHAAGELDSLNSRIAKASELLLRLGLARGFPQVPDRCYMQVNGLSIL